MSSTYSTLLLLCHHLHSLLVTSGIEQLWHFTDQILQVLINNEIFDLSSGGSTFATVLYSSSVLEYLCFMLLQTSAPIHLTALVSLKIETMISMTGSTHWFCPHLSPHWPGLCPLSQSQSSPSSPVSWRVTPSTLGCLKVLEVSASTLSEEVDPESFSRCTASHLEDRQH